ncbi:MAG: YARHG domain-containing protein [Clostridia bacterium]|nr:YARHG domain-containing protein [Clostridia bacterium]
MKKGIALIIACLLLLPGCSLKKGDSRDANQTVESSKTQDIEDPMAADAKKKKNPKDQNGDEQGSKDAASEENDQDGQNGTRHGNPYLFATSSEKLLTENEVGSLNKQLLNIARNEIFSRYGYVFKDPKLREYFERQPWYAPNPSFKGDISGLNDIEKKNIALIQKYEKDESLQLGYYNENPNWKVSIDIDGDGQDESMEYTAKNGEFSLKVNGKLVASKTGDNFADRIKIIDIDYSDSYKEVAVYDDGPSDDPKWNIYAKVEDNFKEVGEINSYTLDTDGSGKFRGSFDDVWCFKPEVILGYWEINSNHELEYKNEDKKKYIGKKYTLQLGNAEDGGLRLIPEGASESDQGSFQSLKSGEQVTLLDINYNGRGTTLKLKTSKGITGTTGTFMGGD